MIEDNKKEEKNNKSPLSPEGKLVQPPAEETDTVSVEELAKSIDEVSADKESDQPIKGGDKTSIEEPAKATDKVFTQESASSVPDKKATVTPENSDRSETKASVPANTEKQDEKPVNLSKKTGPVKSNEKSGDEVKTTLVEKKEAVKLSGLFAFKMSMSTFYNEKGESFPVTALKYEPCFISQVKTKEKESYSAVQVAFKAQKNKRCSKALIQHLAPAGFKEGARFVKEIRQTPPEGSQPGQELSIESIQKGDLVKISALSKGRGFTGVMKRWNFAGGKASHGSKSHRRTGSIGQHTEPARVFPGRKMPGRYGFQKVSRSKVPVVDVLIEERIIFIKGPVPGARNTLVSIQKMEGR